MARVRELLGQAGVLGVDETPGRAAGGLGDVHVACTQFLTHLHTGGRSATDIDAGGVLPGYAGTIVRDGYAGYAHLSDALHAWCGAHSLQDLRAARAAGAQALEGATMERIVGWYRGAVAMGIADNQRRRTQAAKDGLRLARQFAKHEAMILRFATDLAVAFTNNQSERDIGPVKVQQRASGGCWRTLQGLADFAIVWSYLSTAAKWGWTSWPCSASCLPLGRGCRLPLVQLADRSIMTTRVPITVVLVRAVAQPPVLQLTSGNTPPPSVNSYQFGSPTRAHGLPAKWGAEFGSDGGGFPSTFPPPDAGPRGTGRNGRGRTGTAEAVGRPFVHVTADNQERIGMGRDLRGAELAACKIAGLRLPRFESWSCHIPSDLRRRGRRSAPPGH
jgi:hypothetical protein